MRKSLERDTSARLQRFVPLALLITCLVAFGLLSPWLGFYQDDWHFIYYANRGLGKLWELSAYDNRPFASWPYIAGFAVLGFRPFAWQIAGILLRWLTTVIFWFLFRALWPKQANLALIPALLFAVYPLYTLQPMAVTYITHWVCYLLYGASLWLMVLAIRDPKNRPALLILSIALDGIQLFTIEYFNGLELLRPVILWMMLDDPEGNLRRRFGRMTRIWLPFLAVLLAFIFWRSFVFQSPAQDNNAPSVLRELINTPLPTLIYLITAALKDSLLILVGAWSETITPALVDLSPAGLAILGVSLASFAGFYYYLRRVQSGGEELRPIGQMILLGGLGLVLGPIPAWVTHQPLYETNALWNSRLGMASMFGAALVVTGMVEWLVRTARQRNLIYALLIALAIGHLLRSENEYRHAWETEVSFLNQFAWRVPGVAPGTPIVSEGEILPLMGDYPTAFAVNMLYKQPAESEKVLLWYFPTYGDDKVAEKLSTGGAFEESKFSTRFSGEADNSLVVWYYPPLSPCLHILMPQDSGSRLYSDFLRQAAAHSAVGRITTQSDINTAFIRQTLETPENWCSFYQRADLAEQSGDWKEVLQTWDDARNMGLAPTYGAEFQPFIRASLALGDSQGARSFTEAAAGVGLTSGLRPTLCGIWQEAPLADPNTRSQVYKLLQCSSQ